jgi:hypothetical protein
VSDDERELLAKQCVNCFCVAIGALASLWNSEVPDEDGVYSKPMRDAVDATLRGVVSLRRALYTLYRQEDMDYLLALAEINLIDHARAERDGR